MKVYRVEVMIIDHDDRGSEEIKVTIENTRYGNDCITPEVVKMDERDIGEWSDEHPLNLTDGWRAAYAALFATPEGKTP